MANNPTKYESFLSNCLRGVASRLYYYTQNFDMIDELAIMLLFINKHKSIAKDIKSKKYPSNSLIL